jgi:pyruvate,water dikinase
VFTPRWADRPSQLAPLLRAQRAVTESPERRERRTHQTYLDAMTTLGQIGLSRPRRVAIERVVELTREYLALRENQRFWFDRLLHLVQRTALALGERLAARHVLVAAEDIAYLTWPEVQGLVEGSLAADSVPSWVERRRATRSADAAVHPPVFLRGDEGVTESATGARLVGLGISPGRARGRVRLLRHPAEGHRLQAGEILVTHAIDPGWTPLLLHAGGVLLEMGSRLSHGAVVAREYGVPAVANLDGVGRRLVEGQEVTVDGTRGMVWIHP